MSSYLRCWRLDRCPVGWCPVEIQTGLPYRLVLTVQAETITTRVAERELTELEAAMASSLLHLGERPAGLIEDWVPVEVGAVGGGWALCLVITACGSVVVRVPETEVQEET